ncbi:MAG: hypothetical protein EBX44_09905, partial [Betaproteobacteria bacterium]|nr:hypothetical protein [Betaproteobacteria bacterium]
MLKKIQITTLAGAKRIGFAIFLGAVVSGCQVDPFPNDGRVAQDKPTERPVGKPWSIDIPDRLDFIEGEKTEYTIRAHVPAPAKPLLALVDLPVGASFEPASGLLSWRPDFFAGNDPKDPSADFRTYSIRVLLSSSSEPQSVVDKVIAVQVRNTPRPVEMSWNVRQFKMTEGKPFSASVEIKSQD